ncbi:hypothetical protein [Mucispirillum schaedleri]|jgi:archaellum component FlaF (FlaF/FlaG flagellin family)|uniref:Uncharacterized protein n=1 Tax=Mucispirillum schaedleri ASF457 TaxID=1379858 RepID=V2QAU5_9BACT|nr:hypothetical protein [Mucispirillum schaedleri]MCX4359777.1 hypothetical protein [Mucispirillum schaedleri]USF23322.1 hypothetical protein N508_000380 [Mucispirillum schaedleri ASF457]SIW05128.1 conserved hypothetical protein [Mucispirillum schaedleri ASF457]
MHNLNLYSYYDKSLADVNREYLESLKHKPKRVSRRKVNKKAALAAAITLATGLLIANYLGIFSEKVVEVVEAPPPPDTRTEEEKQGYVQIQIFEFAGTPVETISEPSAQNDNVSGKIIQTAQIENTAKSAGIINNKETEKTTDKKKESEKQTTVKSAAVKKEQKNTENKSLAKALVIKKYSILFENIDEKQYNKIKEISEKNNTKLEVTDAYSNTYSIWKVYEKSDTGNEMFGEDKVNHIEDFLTQSDAIEYAKSRNLDALIKQAGITEKSYTVKLCCSELENAKKIAQNSNITDKIIKIVRIE